MLRELRIHIILMTIFVWLASCSYTPPPQEYDIYEVKVKSSLNVRELPKKNSKIIYKLQNGNRIEVVEFENEWAKVRLNPTTFGYVSKDYIVPYKLLPKEDVEEAPIEETNRSQNSNLAQENKQPTVPTPNEVLAKDNSDVKATVSADSIKYGDSYMEVNGIRFSFVTIERPVDPKKIFDVASEAYDSINSLQDKKEGRKWYHKMWDRFSYSDNERYVFVYIRKYKLLEVVGEGSSLSIAKFQEPIKYYEAQKRASENLIAGVNEMKDLILSCRKVYEDKNWFTKNMLKSYILFGNISDFIVGDWLLPCDTFMYKYVVSWLFYVPKVIDIFLINLLKSAIGLLIALTVLFIVLSWLLGVMGEKTDSPIIFTLLRWLLFGLTYACFIYSMVFLMPDYTNIVVMKMNGFSESTVMNADNIYQTTSIGRSWFLIVMLILGYIAKFMATAGYLSQNLKPDEELEADGEKYGFELTLTILACIFFNGIFLLYLTLFWWTNAIFYVMEAVLRARRA